MNRFDPFLGATIYDTLENMQRGAVIKGSRLLVTLNGEKFYINQKGNKIK
jgi:hypothetical protein